MGYKNIVAPFYKRKTALRQSLRYIRRLSCTPNHLECLPGKTSLSFNGMPIAPSRNRIASYTILRGDISRSVDPHSNWIDIYTITVTQLHAHWTLRRTRPFPFALRLRSIETRVYQSHCSKSFLRLIDQRYGDDSLISLLQESLRLVKISSSTNK